MNRNSISYKVTSSSQKTQNKKMHSTLEYNFQIHAKRFHSLYSAATLNKHQIQWQVCRLYVTSRNGS